MFTENGNCQMYHVTKFLIVVKCSLHLPKIENYSGQFLLLIF